MLALAVGCAALVGTSSAISAPFAAAVLGEKIFLDKSISADGSISCATCHRPDRAFADGICNTPSLLNAREHRVLVWDGRRKALEPQVVEPLTKSVEHGIADSDQVIFALRRDDSYVTAFESAFVKPHIEITDVAAALVACAMDRC